MQNNAYFYFSLETPAKCGIIKAGESNVSLQGSYAGDQIAKYIT